ncbi:MAG TPA: hypothetical protein VMU06_07575 [Stellaceae bacterium]|nr:hypothetical protein [Stellaceae bacterium]
MSTTLEEFFADVPELKEFWATPPSERVWTDDVWQIMQRELQSIEVLIQTLREEADARLKPN